MKEFKIEREEGYFVGPSPIGRNKDLSLRAKGLMYVFFTLPPEWDYSLNGLVAICKEGRDVIKNTLSELKKHGYIEISEYRNQKRQIQYKYIVHIVLDNEVILFGIISRVPKYKNFLGNKYLEITLEIKEELEENTRPNYVKVLAPNLDKKVLKGLFGKEIGINGHMKFNNIIVDALCKA